MVSTDIAYKCEDLSITKSFIDQGRSTLGSLSSPDALLEKNL